PLGDGGNLFPSGGIDRVKESALRRLLPGAVDEVPEPSLVPIQPHQRVLRVLRCWTILHCQELLGDAHLARFLPVPMRSGAGSLPSTGRWRSAPIAAQCRSAGNSRQNETDRPSSRTRPTPLSSTPATPWIASPYEF